MQLNVLTTGMTANSNMDDDLKNDHQEPLAIHESGQRHSHHHHQGEMLRHHHADYPNVHHAAHDHDHHSRHSLEHRQNHQLRGNDRVGEPTSIHQMHHGHSLHHQGKSPQDEEHSKLHELWNMMHSATTSVDSHKIHALERHIESAMHSLHHGCDVDWENFCSKEIEKTFVYVDMTRVYCLAKKYDQVSSRCKTTIALLDLTKTNHRGEHGRNHDHHHNSDNHHSNNHGKNLRHHHAKHTARAHGAAHSHGHYALMSSGVGQRPAQESRITFSVNTDTFAAIVLVFFFLWGCCRMVRYCCTKRKQNKDVSGNYEPVGNSYPPSPAIHQSVLSCPLI